MGRLEQARESRRTRTILRDWIKGVNFQKALSSGDFARRANPTPSGERFQKPQLNRLQPENSVPTPFSADEAPGVLEEILGVRAGLDAVIRGAVQEAVEDVFGELEAPKGPRYPRPRLIHSRE